MQHVHTRSPGYQRFVCTMQQNKEEQEEAKKKKRGKKLRHISGIFQLMMCGCGSTVERELLTVLSLFRSLRAPCCIPVCCILWQKLQCPPFFPLLLYTVCVLLLHFFLPSLAPHVWSCFSALHLHLKSFIGYGRLNRTSCKLSFLQTTWMSEGKWSKRDDGVYNMADRWMPGDATSRPLICCALNSVLCLLIGHPLRLFIWPVHIVSLWDSERKTLICDGLLSGM